VSNDETLELLSRTALSHARAGADLVAPAAMMDGQVAAIRSALEAERFHDVAIMAYAAKFASKLYDPFFREATASQVAFGDKRSHQMDCANSDEAMREIALDLDEGADIVMVKPGMYYLDVVYRASREFRAPLAVYSVSGEHAMISAAGELGRLDARAITLELLTSFRRAGADLILTYAAREVASALRAA
jgi:porphobilinogen synthase